MREIISANFLQKIHPPKYPHYFRINLQFQLYYFDQLRIGSVGAEIPSPARLYYNLLSFPIQYLIHRLHYACGFAEELIMPTTREQVELSSRYFLPGPKLCIHTGIDLSTVDRKYKMIRAIRNCKKKVVNYNRIERKQFCRMEYKNNFDKTKIIENYYYCTRNLFIIIIKKKKNRLRQNANR